MSRRKHMTEHVFTAVKLMQKGGATADTIKEYYPVSIDTLRRIKKFDTFAEYLSYQREKNAPKVQKKPEIKPEAPQIVEHRQIVSVPWQVTQEMRKTNELRESISRKLAFIVDELTTTPKKDEK